MIYQCKNCGKQKDKTFCCLGPMTQTEAGKLKDKAREEMSWEERKKYPTQEIEFENGKIVKEFILSEREVDSYISLARAEERERCAKIAEEYREREKVLCERYVSVSSSIAQAILNQK